jgi:succinate-semialdehyde dehydrogenase/glutarate-semialdehyde dehydrogenase
MLSEKLPSVALATGEPFEIVDPSTGLPFASIASSTLSDVEAAVAASVDAFREWKKTSASERAAILEKAADLLLQSKKPLARTLTREQGKPLSESEGEVATAAESLRFYAREAPRMLGEIIPAKRNIRSLVVREPVGVVAAITPWNYPLVLASWAVAPALAAGNSVILKPPSATPLAVNAFADCLVRAGLPDNVLKVVLGSSAVGEALVTNRNVDLVTMTGSASTGRRILALAAPSVTRVFLELGNSSPFIVLEDADVDEAAGLCAYRSFRNMGQICNAVNRIYVDRALHDRFVERLCSRAKELRIGPGMPDDVDLGPMATSEQLKAVLGHIEDAVAKGAEIVSGGKPPDSDGLGAGYFLEPTVLTKVDHSMLVMTEETFGPVAPVMAVDSAEEAVRLANDTIYGLTAYVCSRDLAAALRLAEQLEFGTVSVNNVAGGEVEFPYAGWKQSGLGVGLSHNGLEEYTRVKHIRLAV